VTAIDPGRITVLSGTNGAGKSTVLAQQLKASELDAPS
jgi:ABC-type multidrug transport system ATPase subunit